MNEDTGRELTTEVRTRAVWQPTEYLEPVAMPTVERFAFELSREGRLAENADLIPWDDCRRILFEIDAAMRPPTEEEAIRAVGLLFAAYPSGRPRDPETYARLIRAALMEGPADIAFAAVRNVMRARASLPSVHHVTEAVGGLVIARRRARAVCEAHQAAHKARRAEEERRAGVEADKDAVLKGFEDLKRRLSSDTARSG